MSWNAYTSDPMTAEDAAKMEPDLTGHNFLPDADKATHDQVKAAQKAVAALIKAVGPKDSLYYVNMSGHANPNHEPVPGWANETITITVSVSPPVSLPTPESDDTAA